MKNLKVVLASFLLIIILFTFEYKNISINDKVVSTIKSNEYNKDIVIDKKESDKIKDENIVGYIKIPNTNINTKIFQANDNEFYLKYPDKVILDYRNNIIDRKLLIYGHNSRTLKNAVFHDLELYLNENFYIKNKYIYLNLNSEETKWEIFSIMIKKAKKYPHTIVSFNDSDWITHLNWLKEESIYDTHVSVNKNDKIITLQTCYYKPANSFLVISAKKIN